MSYTNELFTWKMIVSKKKIIRSFVQIMMRNSQFLWNISSLCYGN